MQSPIITMARSLLITALAVGAAKDSIECQRSERADVVALAATQKLEGYIEPDCNVYGENPEHVGHGKLPAQPVLMRGRS